MDGSLYVVSTSQNVEYEAAETYGTRASKLIVTLNQGAS